MKTLLRSRWFVGIICVVVGAAAVLAIRVARYKPEEVHYHANFALYINGKREQFKGPQYYSDIEMCTTETDPTPTDRAHMHDNINNVVHVEDHATTWGQFFTNLGWTIGPTFVADPNDTIYAEQDAKKLHLMLNGKDYTDLGGMQNMVIHDKDVLLVSYGDATDTQLQRQYNAIPHTAAQYDTAKDPASCGSNAPTSMRARLQHMF